MKFTFKLKKEAKKSGGDRYSCEEILGWDIYFPQQISRLVGKVREKIEIEVPE